MKGAWDKIVLAIVLLLVAVAATALALLAPTAAEITGVDLAPKGGATPKPADEAELQKIVKSAQEAVEWKAPLEKELFVGPEILFNPNDLTFSKPIDAVYQGIPIAWLRQNNIAISTNVAFEDQDKDGFSNSVEFNAKTNPTDPESHPPFLTRLRMAEFEVKIFKLRFQNVNDLEGKKQFTIRDNTEKKNYFVYIGDKVKESKPGAGDGFVVKDFRFKMVKETNVATGVTSEVDRSELDLLEERIGNIVTLVRDKDIESPDSTANFIMLLPGETEKVTRVKQGNDFEIRGNTYRLLAADASGAKIRDMKTNTEIKIEKLKPEEKTEVPGGQ
jgi:hypothetical protein